MAMNINDVEPVDIPPIPKDQATLILARQSMLEEAYWKIEHRHAPVVNINSRPGQILIKDFLWRIVEEVGETLEAYDKGDPIEKIHEELADGLHFVAGLTIIANYKGSFITGWEIAATGPQVKPGISNRYLYVTDLVSRLGIVGNTLKLKPWKQTDVLTDEVYFGSCLMSAVSAYVRMVSTFNLSPTQLCSYYYRKSEVNLFRIRSKY